MSRSLRNLLVIGMVLLILIFVSGYDGPVLEDGPHDHHAHTVVWPP